MTVQERVENGVEWLDSNHPSWVKDIELAEFDIGSCRHCILGQIFGSFFEAPDEVHQDAEDMGFDFGKDSDGDIADANDLQVEWERVINERRESREL